MVYLGQDHRKYIKGMGYYITIEGKPVNEALLLGLNLNKDLLSDRVEQISELSL